jgi:dolichyl-phosphate-mannose--protein O-mannosyl transferase
MPVLEYSITSQWYNPIERVLQMLNVAKGLNLDSGINSSTSQPWDWLINRGIIIYSYQPQYLGLISPTITMMVIPCLAYWLCKMFKREKAVILTLAWIICAYGSWILISLMFERMMYIYYFYPVVGAICLGTGLILSGFLDCFRTDDRWNLKAISKWLVTGYLALHLAIFIIISPLMPSIVSWINL